MRTACAAVALLGVAVSALGASPADDGARRVGLGVSLGKEIIPAEEDWVLSLFDFPSFYVPVAVSPRFRLEPEIGLYRHSYSEDDSDYSNTILRFGCGAFAVRDKGKADIYYGARLGLERSSYSHEWTWDGQREEIKRSRTDLGIAPTFGGEYFLSEHLSFGGEAQVGLSLLVKEDVEEDVSSSDMGTSTRLFVRWYP